MGVWIPDSHSREEEEWCPYRHRRRRGRATSRREICDRRIRIRSIGMIRRRASMCRFLSDAGELDSEFGVWPS